MKWIDFDGNTEFVVWTYLNSMLHFQTWRIFKVVYKSALLHLIYVLYCRYHPFFTKRSSLLAPSLPSLTYNIAYVKQVSRPVGPPRRAWGHLYSPVMGIPPCPQSPSEQGIQFTGARRMHNILPPKFCLPQSPQHTLLLLKSWRLHCSSLRVN